VGEGFKSMLIGKKDMETLQARGANSKKKKGKGRELSSEKKASTTVGMAGHCQGAEGFSTGKKRYLLESGSWGMKIPTGIWERVKNWESRKGGGGQSAMWGSHVNSMWASQWGGVGRVRRGGDPRKIKSKQTTCCEYKTISEIKNRGGGEWGVKPEGEESESILGRDRWLSGSRGIADYGKSTESDKQCEKDVNKGCKGGRRTKNTDYRLVGV